MTADRISEKVLAAKVAAVEEMLRGIATLPLGTEEEFLADPRMVAAGESYLRRALEALLDLGRHLLAKGFGIATSEYREIPRHLEEQGVIEEALAERFAMMARYRNRMVHFYQEVTPSELYGILTGHLSDVERALRMMGSWLIENPDRLLKDL